MTKTVEIALTRGLFALVDESDAANVLAAGPWHAIADRRGTFYAGRREACRIERLHNFLTGWPLVDHVNGDGLDNRRANLREASIGENARNRRRPKNNTSGYKGVSWHRRIEMWMAYISVDGRRVHLGYFDDLTEAARAYDTAARELHGKFARLNLPEVA